MRVRALVLLSLSVRTDASPDLVEAWRKTGDVCAITHAGFAGTSRTTKKWVRDGKDIDALCMHDGEGKSLLVSAVIDGDHALVIWLLGEGASVDLRSTKRQETALQVSVASHTHGGLGGGYVCHKDILLTLISAGADVNAQSRLGSTALIAAAFDGAIACVSELLLAGADKHLTDAEGRTALDCAAQNGHDKTAALIQNYDAPRFSLGSGQRRVGFHKALPAGLALVLGLGIALGWGVLRWRRAPKQAGAQRNVRRAAYKARKAQRQAAPPPPAQHGQPDGGTVPECVICLGERPTHAFVPCGHRCICSECSKIGLQAGGIRTCAVCRAEVESSFACGIDHLMKALTNRVPGTKVRRARLYRKYVENLFAKVVHECNFANTKGIHTSIF